MGFRHALCWLRRDLRWKDHAALCEATRNAERTTLCFVFDTTILSRLEDRDDRRVSFLHRSLEVLDREVRARGSALVVRHGDPRVEIPKVARELRADALFFNEDYEPSAKERDSRVRSLLEKTGVAVNSYKDHVIFRGSEIRTKTGEPYRVFTPYKRAWLARLNDLDVREWKPELKKLTPLRKLSDHLQPWPLEKLGFVPAKTWIEPGWGAAEKKLGKFRGCLADYGRDRDFPALEGGTSALSAHLRFGTISTRELVRTALAHRSEGAKVWLSELVWRDFYQMILDRFPHVVTGAFRPQYDSIRWPGREEHFEAWKGGRTGYPIIDAAMRHFAETGWMHNRMRMVAASFLVKDLLIDWRKGEAWFARKLLDFDLAANNGGWQWCASTGCDAQPYFRIFNPVSQSKRFDPKGDFIRANLQELSKMTAGAIHSPWTAGGPLPIVEHAEQRRKALHLYRLQKSPDLKEGAS